MCFSNFEVVLLKKSSLDANSQVLGMLTMYMALRKKQFSCENYRQWRRRRFKKNSEIFDLVF
jgi:hypothetical protein